MIFGSSEKKSHFFSGFPPILLNFFRFGSGLGSAVFLNFRFGSGSGSVFLKIEGSGSVRVRFYTKKAVRSSSGYFLWDEQTQTSKF